MSLESLGKLWTLDETEIQRRFGTLKMSDNFHASEHIVFQCFCEAFFKINVYQGGGGEQNVNEIQVDSFEVNIQCTDTCT